jgi:hypothetical protein
LKKYVKVSLYTDSVPNPRLTRSESDRLAAQHTLWQDALGDPALPYYVVLRPARDTPSEEGRPKGTVLGKAKGKIFDVESFVRLLQQAQTEQTAQLSRPAGE